MQRGSGTNVGALIFFGLLFALIMYVIVGQSGLLREAQVEWQEDHRRQGSPFAALAEAAGSGNDSAPADDDRPASAPFDNAAIAAMGSQQFSLAGVGAGVYILAQEDGQDIVSRLTPLKPTTGRKWPNTVKNYVPVTFDLFIVPEPSDWKENTLLVDYDVSRNRIADYGNNTSLDVYSREKLGNGVLCEDIFLGSEDGANIITILVIAPETYCLVAQPEDGEP